MEESPMDGQVTSLSREVIRSHPLLGLFFGDSPNNHVNVDESSIDGIAADPLVVSNEELTRDDDLADDLTGPATLHPSMDVSMGMSMGMGMNTESLKYTSGHPYYTSTDVSSESTAIDSDAYLGPVVKNEDLSGDLKIPTVDEVDSFESGFGQPTISPPRTSSPADTNVEDSPSVTETMVTVVASGNYLLAPHSHPTTVHMHEANRNTSPDTLEALLTTPLARTNDDFARKYPEKIEMTPPSDEPIEHPAINDILFGRGGLTNHHPGNKRYRQIVNDHKLDYIHAAKMTKPRVARRIVHALRHANYPARFLRKSPKDGLWRDVGDKVASEKTSQALREKSPEERKAAAERKRAKKAATSSELETSANMDKYTLMYAANITHSLSDEGDIILGDIDGKVETQMASKFSPLQDNSIFHSMDIAVGNTFSRYPVEGGVFGTMNAEGHIQITDNDVLCGRGGAVNNHRGNIIFREMASSSRAAYQLASRHDKGEIANRLVQAVRSTNPPGRFLKKGPDGNWTDVGDVKASEKACQVMKDKSYALASAAQLSASLAPTNVCMPVVSSIDAMQMNHEEYLCAPPIPPLPYSALGGQQIPLEQYIPKAAVNDYEAKKRPAEHALDSPDASRYKFDEVTETVDV